GVVPLHRRPRSAPGLWLDGDVRHETEVIRRIDGPLRGRRGLVESEARREWLSTKLSVGSSHEDVIDTPRRLVRDRGKSILAIEGVARRTVSTVRPGVGEV